MNPTGFVTFLFTDIEGSTKLAQDYPETLQSALEKHNVIMRNAIESNNGYVFEIVGDAFCCAFEKAEDAVMAAVDAQLGLSNENWGEEVIKIRIGIHSGTAEWNGERYTGYITLARSARVMSCGYGEQIIISENTFQLCKEKFEAEQENSISFRDLGERRLKDVIHPIRLYQIISPGLREEFPPLKTLDARPNNLPVQSTSFIGRVEEIRQIRSLLKELHMLTLTGSGGLGKTRLVLQVAADVIDEFENGVWFVDLSALSDPHLLTQSVTKSLGIHEHPNLPLEEALMDFLNSKEILIVLDNCEHIVQACSELAERLLSKISRLKVIATSREELRCAGERVHRLMSLKIPDPAGEFTLDSLIQNESVRLFTERAVLVNSNFRLNNDNARTVVQICNQLEGIPLAIELAAARTKIFSVEMINERLQDRFNLLSKGKRTAAARHQTLKSMIDWSYDLLSGKEKILWSRLSVFAGSWTIKASEYICSDEELKENEIFEILNSLTEKSIVNYDAENERYRMLETLRQYGENILEQSAEKEIIFKKHLKYYSELAEASEPELRGADIKKWLEILESENDNFEKALSRSSNKQINELCMSLAGALGSFWEIKGYYTGGRRWFECVLSCCNQEVNAIRGKALFAAGTLARIQGEYALSKKFSRESLSIRRKLKNRSDVASSMQSLGHLAFVQTDYHTAEKYYNESLVIRSKLNDKAGIASSLNSVGNVTFNQGKYEQAFELYRESLEMKIEIGDKRGVAFTLINMGNAAFELGEYEKAKSLYKESLEVCRELGDKRGIASCLFNYGNLLLITGESDEARKQYEESLLIKQQIGDKTGIASSYYRLGTVAAMKEEYHKASEFYRMSLSLNRSYENKKEILKNITGLAEVHFAEGDLKKVSILIGFISANLESLKSVMKKQEISHLNKIWLGISGKLNQENYIKYQDKGRSLSFQVAVEINLNITKFISLIRTVDS